MTVQNHLRELASLLADEAQQIDDSVQSLNTKTISFSEQQHSLSNLMLKIDLMLTANRERFDELRKEYRSEN